MVWAFPSYFLVSSNDSLASLILFRQKSCITFVTMQNPITHNNMMNIKLKLRRNSFSNPMDERLKAKVQVLVTSVPCTSLNPLLYQSFQRGDNVEGTVLRTAIPNRTLWNVWMSQTPIIFYDAILDSITNIAKTSNTMIAISRG